MVGTALYTSRRAVERTKREQFLPAPRPPDEKGSVRLTGRTELEHLAIIAGFARNAQLASAICGLGHDWHHRDDVHAPRSIEGARHRRLLAEPDQVAGGWKRQLETAILAARQRLARRDPDRVGRFPAVMGAKLVRRRGRQE